MRVFHRIRQSLSVSIESLLDQVENQEAVVAAMIREVEQAATRVRAHRKTCERHVSALGERCQALDADARLWRERARRLEQDRSTALECLRRARAADRERQSESAKLERQTELLASITADEDAMDEKLGELRRRHAALTSREARALAECGDPSLTDIHGVLDRWEARIEGHEVRSNQGAKSPDAFARELTRTEEDAELAAELERLLRKEQAL